MTFSASLGPGHVARQLCRPGEHLVWAMYRTTFHYAVDGLDHLGAPSRSLLTRDASAVMREVGDASAIGRGVGASAAGRGGGALSMVLGGSDENDSKTSADHLVFGPSGDALAPAAMSRFEPGRKQDRLWALTSERLVVAERQLPPAEQERSILGAVVGLGKAVSFGKAVGFSKAVGGFLTDRRRTYGEGEPVTVPVHDVVAEFPRTCIAAAAPDRVTLTDGSGFEFLLGTPAPVSDEVVVRELTRFWLRPGEHLVLGLPPIAGHVGGVVGGTLHVPWTAVGDTPALEPAETRWLLPAPPSPPDWIDDPALGYWLEAPDTSCAAVRLADHFASSRGNARLAVSDQRVAVVYPSHLLATKPSTVFTTFAEIPRTAVRSMEHARAGLSLPARPVVRLTFADGSVLTLRQP
ncbi:hypothetical protein SAMN05216553_106403 [Lentzea fradiae]|uniref:Uncharacterized protein n=1 Tax=Lentzea fradiae TaxID=200378 RepID=A0A1G7SQM9_9PSEU|nr:hypothetical protein [Lentzea fradiae]SDG25261.1 hypothetical protein SAMN05216553_106403 [Lentzea fradiae]